MILNLIYNIIKPIFNTEEVEKCSGLNGRSSYSKLDIVKTDFKAYLQSFKISELQNVDFNSISEKQFILLMIYLYEEQRLKSIACIENIKQSLQYEISTGHILSDLDTLKVRKSTLDAYIDKLKEGEL